MPTLTRLDRIDASLQIAWHNLRIARTRAAYSPNRDTMAAELEAEALVDLWLDRRLEAQQ